MALDESTYDLPVARTVLDLREAVSDWRDQGATVALIPTMGALHSGHTSLITEAAKVADKIVVSIFVNPTQFAPHEDFDDYPRTEAADVKALTTTSTNLIYAPKNSEMYAADFSSSINVGGVSEGLCSDTRPHFFAGVSIVVAKLLLQCLPDIAVFGEKDYQQLLVIRRMVRDLDIPVQILSAPIARENDGLAISSRNVYLSAQERGVAAELNKTLRKTAKKLNKGETIEDVFSAAKTHLASIGFGPIDYLELRDANTLEPLSKIGTPARLLVAATLGQTRLIDNIAI